MRAILSLGVTCSIASGQLITLSRARDTGFDLHQLERSTGSPRKGSYLDHGRRFKYNFLFHACSSDNGVHVFALFGEGTAASVHIVDPASHRSGFSSLTDSYLSMVAQQRKRQSETIINYPETLEFKVAYHSNDTTAMKAVSRELALKEYRSHILVLASRREFSYYEQGISSLSSMPVIRMASTSNSFLDRLAWQRIAVQALLSHYLALGEWLHDSIKNSIYYDVPIGNTPFDQSLFFMDVAFARRLMKQDMVLWWSPGNKPDLGGREADSGAGALSEELISPESSKPGCYMNVCLMVEMRNLAVNSVLQSSLVNELEGSGGTTSFDSVSHTLNEYANGDSHANVTLGDSVLSPQTFFILKNLVKGWMLDKASGPDNPADLAIAYFWRWISSPSSHMYDLSVHRFIHGLMVKTFFQIQAEFRRLGSTVIYADFGQILLLTSKAPGNAAAYATYITAAVMSNELFKHIQLHTDRYYDFLLYLDSANQGGIVCLDPRAKEPSNTPCMTNTWNIQAFLPPAIQPHFHQEVSRFIVDLYRIRTKHSATSKTPMRVLDATYTSGVQPDEHFQQEQEEIRTYISHRLTRRLLSVVNKIVQRHRNVMMEDLPEEDYEFPLLPGSYLNFTNPALEFVKSLCEVFGLARDYSIEIGLMRRSLLDIVGVREFAEEAVWRMPCQTVKLSMVICHYCNSMRDFDFCRDADLMPRSSASGTSYKWTCTTCETEYDRRAIERSMIDMVKRIEMAFQVQDLKCTKCRRIKVDNLNTFCECSGSVACTISKVEGRRKLRTIVNVADVHNLAMLKVSSIRYSFRGLTQTSSLTRSKSWNLGSIL